MRGAYRQDLAVGVRGSSEVFKVGVRFGLVLLFKCQRQQGFSV